MLFSLGAVASYTVVSAFWVMVRDGCCSSWWWVLVGRL